MVENAARQEIVRYPTDEELRDLYGKIETTAVGVIKSGKAVGNPFIKAGIKDTRYCISADAPIDASPIASFLAHAANQIAAIEPSFKAIPKELLHLTLTEMTHGESGRKGLGVKAAQAKGYYEALVSNYPSSKPIRLELLRIMPTPDAPPNPNSPEERSIAVVDAGLDFIERPGIGFLKVIFVTLGRFAEAPKREGETIPLLDKLGEINKNIPPDPKIIIDGIVVDSSTPINYFEPRGYTFLWPPIPLDKGKRTTNPPRFLTSNQARKLIGAQ